MRGFDPHPTVQIRLPPGLMVRRHALDVETGVRFPGGQPKMMRVWPNGLRHLTTNQEIAGSTPAARTKNNVPVA